jgi:hypothetical protein
VRLLLWILLIVCAAVLQHARLCAYPVAPDLPLALAAWAVVVGDPQAWMWRVWLAGALRDPVDPGSQWFHAGAHLALILLLVPLRRWLPGVRWLALLLTGAGLSAAIQGLDILVGGRGGWQWWSGLLTALLTGGCAVLFGRLAPGPKRTVTVPEDQGAERVPERSDGISTPA